MCRPFRIILAGGIVAVCCGIQAGCNQTAWPERDGSMLIDPVASGLEFWPPSRGYLPRGDSALLLLRGLQRVYSCTQLLQLRAEFRPTSGDSQTLGVRTTIQLPSDASCSRDPDGLDTTLRVGIFQTGGTRIFLRNGSAISARADTVVEGNSRLDSLDFIPDSTRTARVGNFLFLDSSLAQSKRRLVSDLMPTCETFEGAVFVRLGAVYRVRFRRLELDSLLHASMPPCMGTHVDSIETVFDQFGYAQRP